LFVFWGRLFNDDDSWVKVDEEEWWAVVVVLELTLSFVNSAGTARFFAGRLCIGIGGLFSADFSVADDFISSVIVAIWARASRLPTPLLSPFVVLLQC